MLIDTELLILNLMSYSGIYCLNKKIIIDFFEYLANEIRKRGLTFFEVNLDFDILLYMTKYIASNENDEIILTDNIDNIINYLKMNFIDDEIDAIINNFVVKYSFENRIFIDNYICHNHCLGNGEVILKRQNK